MASEEKKMKYQWHLSAYYNRSQWRRWPAANENSMSSNKMA
jgi:hypothetical protein